MLERWERELGARTFDVHREMTRLTFRIVGRTLLSPELDGDASAIGDALTIGLHWANEYAESLMPSRRRGPTPGEPCACRRPCGTFDELI